MARKLTPISKNVTVTKALAPKCPIKKFPALMETIFVNIFCVYVSGPKVDPNPKSVVVTKALVPEFFAEWSDREIHSSHGTMFVTSQCLRLGAAFGQYSGNLWRIYFQRDLLLAVWGKTQNIGYPEIWRSGYLDIWIFGFWWKQFAAASPHSEILCAAELPFFPFQKNTSLVFCNLKQCFFNSTWTMLINGARLCRRGLTS